MLAMRMRDGQRWVYAYREAAYERALDEARHRTFFGAMFYALTHSMRLLRP
jgi:hypothetical protein